MEDFLLLITPALLGSLVTMGLCMLCGRRSRPSFWLALLSSVATGIVIFVSFFGFSVFTSDFWAGLNLWKSPGLDVFLIVFGFSTVSSFAFSLGVVFLYRLRQNRIGRLTAK